MGKDRIDSSFIGHPKPLFGLAFTEVWERFSWYGIRPLLVLFMIATMNEGGLGLDRASASAIVGILGGSSYLATLPGGYLTDNWLGQRNAVFIGALIMALGHLSIGLSIFFPFMFFLGLILIILGGGLYKPCIGIIVGLLYKQGDIRRDSGFTIFYMAVNIGAFIAPLICGFVAKEYGWHLGFAVGGVGMLIATLMFYFKALPDLKEFEEKIGIDSGYNRPVSPKKNIGLYTFIALSLLAIFIILCVAGVIKINPVSIAKEMLTVICSCVLLYFLYLFFFAGLTNDEKKRLIAFVVLFIAATVFWSTFEQQPTAFNLFTQDYTDRMIFGWEIPTAWFQSVNPLFVIMFAPIMSIIWIALARKNREISSISKFTLGIVLGAIGSVIMVIASYVVLKNGGMKISPLWIIASYFFLTIGELALSPVGLSLVTSIAPKGRRSQMMSLWFAASSLGSVVAGLIGGEVAPDKLESLPEVFATTIYSLLAMTAILLLLRKPLKKMLKSGAENS